MSEDTRQAQREQIAAGVGLALAEWNIVETTLSHIFVSAVDRSSQRISDGLTLWDDERIERRISHRIINAIIGFDTKIDAISAAISENDVSDEVKALWPWIAEKVRKKYKKRYEIAHYTIQNRQQEDGSCKILLTPFSNTIGSYSQKTYNRHDIDQRACIFKEYRLGLAWLRRKLESDRGRLPAPLLPEPELIQRARHALESQTPSESP